MKELYIHDLHLSYSWISPWMVLLGALGALYLANTTWPRRFVITRRKFDPRAPSNISTHKTQIIRALVSHSRLFPEKHRFAYRYLSVGIPVRSPTSNWLLSVDTKSWWQRGWLHVTAKDHLSRGIAGETLAENLDDYLKQQGLDPAEFPHVYLLTAARFLGYKFSPASFWYLYSPTFQLTHVIAEVNNTFHERRMYLLPASELANETFQQSLFKDFHVSPFNSRKGSYVVLTADPRRSTNISVCVTLSSSKGHPKMVARWWSVGNAVDPSECTLPQAFMLLGSWGWSVLLTYVIIVYEAVLLSKKLSMWYRPEPRETTVPRRPCWAESFLASRFEEYLRHLSPTADMREKGGGVALSIRCSPTRQWIHIQVPHDWNDTKQPEPTASPTADEPPRYELRVHAPNFYRQMITYETLSDLLSHAVLEPNEENRTVWSNAPERVVGLLSHLEEQGKSQGRKTDPENSPIGRQILSTVLLGVAWALHGVLRAKRPLIGAYPDGRPQSRTNGAQDSWRRDGDAVVGQQEKCFLDDFVRCNASSRDQAWYVAATLWLQLRTRVMGVIGGE